MASLFKYRHLLFLIEISRVTVINIYNGSSLKIMYFFIFFILEALVKYKTKNGTYPTCLVVFRDGVGEGQISHVHKTEIKLMKVI